MRLSIWTRRQGIDLQDGSRLTGINQRRRTGPKQRKLKVANAERFMLRNKGGTKTWVKLQGVMTNSESINGTLERRLLVGKKIRRPQNARNIRVSQYQGTGDDTAWLRGCDGY